MSLFYILVYLKVIVKGRGKKEYPSRTGIIPGQASFPDN